jgi:GNAT superfamily N-acetyltransferase
MITYHDIEGTPDVAEREAIRTIYKTIFTNIDSDKFNSRMALPGLFTTLAFTHDNLIAFKVGYAVESKIFYSWIGGVLPQYRGQGVAQVLMERQHNWCRQNGFEQVTTKTMNRWRNMLILNLKNGFDITSTYHDDAGELKILLTKDLRRQVVLP